MPARALSLLVLGALGGALAATSAVAAPKVVSHTYLVRYHLAGNYAAVTSFQDDTQGYCPGTGFTETTSFDVTWAGKIRVKLDGEGLASKRLLSPTRVGDWKQEGKVVASGDDCASTMPEKCAGDLGLSGDPGVTDNLYARGKGHRIRFLFALAGVPAEDHSPGDCGATTDAGPPVTYYLVSALKPFDYVYFDIPIESLAKHGSFSGSARPGIAVHGYSPETCDHAPACSGAFAHMVRKITVKQLS